MNYANSNNFLGDCRLFAENFEESASPAGQATDDKFLTVSEGRR